MLIFFLLFFIGLFLGIQIYNFLSGRRFIADLRDAYKINKMSLREASERWTSSPKSLVVVSLTTIPSRLPHLDLVLKSLLTQSLAPQKIKVYIPEFSQREQCPYIVPDYLHSLSGVEIIKTDDFGPATKFIPAIQTHDPEQLILVVDDDKIYDNQLISRLQIISESMPDRVIASSGWIVPRDLIDKPTNLIRNLFLIPPTPIHGSRIKKPLQVDIVMGCSGFLIKPKFFDREALLCRDQVPQALWYVDDVWVSGHCKVDKFVFPAERCCFHYFKLKNLYKKTSLGLINRGPGSYQYRHNTIGIQFFKKRWMNKEAL